MKMNDEHQPPSMVFKRLVMKEETSTIPTHELCISDSCEVRITELAALAGASVVDDQRRAFWELAIASSEYCPTLSWRLRRLAFEPVAHNKKHDEHSEER
jgi:hypothetical protein